MGGGEAQSGRGGPGGLPHLLLPKQEPVHGLREDGRAVWWPAASLGVVDHVNPTAARRTTAMSDAASARQVSYFGENGRDFGIEIFDVLHPSQGIEHVVAPELGFILPA
jgi:3-isopropylmalate/(R)-2-methylmalate dehydratase large subunit